jgi:hypothetical protein
MDENDKAAKRKVAKWGSRNIGAAAEVLAVSSVNQ